MLENFPECVAKCSVEVAWKKREELVFKAQLSVRGVAY